MRVNKTVSAVLATTFAGAVALGGVTAGTAFAADEPRSQFGQQAPLPKAQKLQQQARALGETADALKPVAEVIQAVLNAPEGRLSESEADHYAKAVHEALAPLVQQSRQQDQYQSTQDQVYRDVQVTEQTAMAAVALGEQVDELLRAAEAGNQRAIAREAERALQAAVDLMAEASADNRLPNADRQDVREQQAPKSGQIPQLPENKLPPGDAELELLPN